MRAGQHLWQTNPIDQDWLMTNHHIKSSDSGMRIKSTVCQLSRVVGGVLSPGCNGQALFKEEPQFTQQLLHLQVSITR